MHEVALSQSLIREAEKVAARHKATKITGIRLSVGLLSCADARQLACAFRIASAGTMAQDATLKIDQVPIYVWCTGCLHTTQASINALNCEKCGSFQVNVISGEELSMTEVEVE